MTPVVCCFLAGLMLIMATSAYFAYHIFPEIGMVVHSQCSNPTPNWNGKIMGTTVWKNGFDGRNSTHNSYLDTTEDRRRRGLLLDSGFNVENTERILESVTNRPDDPIIVWGSHHKTGTYVAQKAFSHMCKRMGWCCIFHVTRDSINVIRDVLASEPIKVLGHTQFIWNPRELGIKHYRFVHFYRKPYRKIISGFRYHRDGAEAWCLKPTINYTKACDFSPKTVTSAIVPYKRLVDEHYIRGGAEFTEPKHMEAAKLLKYGSLLGSSNGQLLSRASVQDYCHSVHLCEPCCRREHEVDPHVVQKVNEKSSTSKSKSEHKSKEPNTHSGDPHNQKANKTEGLRALAVDDRELATVTAVNPRSYSRNPQFVYDFQCANLGPMSELSLTETLTQIPVVQGLRVEASIDYYESLRMARIYNETYSDKYSLNIDLDALMKDYGGTMRTIIRHLDLALGDNEKEKLANELDFFDVDNSPLYRWSMTNPLVNHIDTKSASDPTNYAEILKDDTVIAHVYAHIHDLMYWAHHEGGPQSAAEKRITKDRKVSGW